MALLVVGNTTSPALAEPAPRTPAKEPAAARVPAPRPTRVYSRRRTTFIYPRPSRKNAWIGYVRVGQSVKLRSPDPQPGPGCQQGFVAIEPYGYVCLDRTATLTPNGRYVKAMQQLSPGSGPLPFNYALSNGTPMYRRLPSPEEWRKSERFYGSPGSHQPLSWGNRGHELLAEDRTIAATDPVPFFLRAGGSPASQHPTGLVRRQIPLGSMLAYTHAVAHEGRTFLVSADGTIVPADRVRPYRESTFQGVELGRDGDLPLAFIRSHARPKYQRTADGDFRATAMSWAVRSWIELESGLDPVKHAGRTYLATRDRDRGQVLWLAEGDATVIRRRDRLPWGVTDRDKWIIVSITNGTLVAYEGPRPVFATLVSPGAGGVPVKGQDPVKMSTTPLGVYRVTFKHVAADMSPEQGDNRSFWIADVPYTQYFNAPFALHVAYWHENFGELMSAGCVNVSPRDGRRLFYWTDPPVPPGWAGAGPSQHSGKGSFVVITR